MSDFPNNIDETIKEFLPIFPNFNYDLFDEYEDRLNFFYVDLQQSIIDETRDKICYLEEDPIKNNIADLLLKYTLQCYPEPFESHYSTYLKTKYVKEYVKEYIYNNSLTKNDKVVILSHSSFLKIFISDIKEEDVYEDMPKPTAKYEFANCKFYNYGE